MSDSCDNGRGRGREAGPDANCIRVKNLLEEYYSSGLSHTQAEEVREHLEGCEACRREAALIGSLARAVRELEKDGKVYHPTAEALTQLALEGEDTASLDSKEKAAALAHLKWCTVCRETFEAAKAVAAAFPWLKQEAAERANPDSVIAGRVTAGAPVSRAARAGWRAKLRGMFRKPAFAMGFAAGCVAVVAAALYLGQTGLRGLGGDGDAGGASWQELIASAEVLAAAGEADSAAAVADQALGAGLREAPAGKDTVSIRLYRDGVGHTYYVKDRAEAERLYIAALAVKEKTSGATSPEVADLLLDLGWIHLASGAGGAGGGAGASGAGGPAKYEQARAAFARCLAIRQQALPAGAPDIGRAICALAEADFLMQDLRLAESTFGQGRAILEKALGPDHPDVAVALLGEGKSIGTQWRHAEAVPFYERALEIRRAALSEDDPDLSDMVMRMGNLYKQMARYSDAERLFEDAASMREGLPAPNLDLAMSLDHIAEIRERQGRYAEAEEPYKRALEIRKAALGPDHPDVGAGYHYLGGVCAEMARYDEAESYYRLGLKLREKLGRDHPDVATSLTDVAGVSERKGDWGEAEKYLERALAIREKALGEVHPGVPHPGVAASLGNLAALYTRQGKYAEAEPLYARAVSILEGSMGPWHPATAYALAASSELYRLEGKGDLALATAERAAVISQGVFAENAVGMTEDTALRYAQMMRHSIGNYLAILFEVQAGGGGAADEAAGKAAGAAGTAGTAGGEVPAQTGIAGGTAIAATPGAIRAADLIFRSKGQVSEETFERQRLVARADDPEMGALVRSLRAARGELAELAVQGFYGAPVAYQARADSLRNEAGRIETELARRSADFRREIGYRDISAERLASLLPAGSALVEFVRFDAAPAGSDSARARYLAVVLGKDGRPTIADLGEAARIDGLVGAYRDHMLAASESAGKTMTEADAAEYRRLSGEMFAAVWRPIERYVQSAGASGDGGLVLIAPDGPLSTVSFAALTDGAGEYLVERYPIHYLASGRDLAQLADKPEPGRGLLAMGDPDYSAPVGMRLDERALALGSAARVEVAALTRNVRSGSEKMKNLEPVPSLPGSRLEVDRIAWAWDASNREPRAIHLGPAASEERFKAEAPGKRVIHLATHGFFLEGLESVEGLEGADGTRGAAGSGPETQAAENPLLLSGLMLAGANLRGADADAPLAEDGILTAYEISSMDLGGTEMVVLSACETGLGRAETGEGVYGLRRSFQIAGARTVVSALWSLPDGEVTAEITSGLYERGGKSIPQAMREMQLKAIRATRARGGVDHPYSWGAFVAVGDWK